MFGVIQQLFEVPVRSAPAAERERLLSGAATVAAGLFADAPIDHATRADGGFATLHGLYWLAAGIAGGHPLVLTVDDAHWADEPTLRALSFLAGRIADVPIVLVITLRSHEPSGAADVLAGLESDPNACRMELLALGPAGVAEIVQAVIPAAGDELCRAVYEATGGNPLYVRELLRSVTAGDGGMPSIAAVREAAVAPVGERVMRRVAALGPHAPRLAAAMAVLGASGRLRDAAEVAGQSEDGAAGAARAMRRVEILGVEDPFEWTHPIVQRSIYDALTVTERDALHARVARYSRGGRVTRCCGGAPFGAPPRRLHRRRHGAAGGRRRSAHPGRARRSRGAPPARARRRRRRATPCHAAPRARAGRGHAPRSRRNGRPGGGARGVNRFSRAALATLALTESYTFAGRWDTAADVMEQGLELLDDLEPELVLELELAHCLACAVDPSLVDALPAGSCAPEGTRPRRVLARARSVRRAGDGVGIRRRRPRGRAALCDHALGDGILISERSAGAYAPTHVLAALVTIDEFERALDFTAELERAARAQGSVANVMAATGVRGWTCLVRGDLAGGEEILRPLVDTAAENGMVLLLVTLLWWMTDVIIERPSNEALAAMVESIELPPAFAEVAGGAWLLSVRGRLRAAQGRAKRPRRICGRRPGCSRDSVSVRCTPPRAPRSRSARTGRSRGSPGAGGRGAGARGPCRLRPSTRHRTSRRRAARGPRRGSGAAARVGRGAR